MAENKNTEPPKRIRIIKDSLIFTIGLLINYFFTLIGSIATARLLSLENYGVWKTIQLAMQYGNFTNLGINNAISKLAPALYSSGKKDKFESLIHNAMRIGLALPALIFAAAVVSQFVTMDAKVRMIFLVFGTALFFAQVYDLCEISLAAMKRFSLKGMLNAFFAIIKVGAIIAGAYFFSLAGVLIAFVASGIFVATAESLIVKLPLKGNYDKETAKNLFAHSLPITLMLISETMFFTSDKFIVTTFLGQEQFGIYSLGLIIAPFIMMLPLGIRQVISINVYDEYGKNEMLSSIEKYYTKSVLILSHIVPLLGAMCYFFIPFLIAIILPNYTKSIHALQLYILLSLFICIIQTSQSVLVVMKKEGLVIGMYLSMMLLNSLLSLWQIKANRGFEAVLLAHFPGMIFYGLFIFYYIMTRFGKTGGAFFSELINTYSPMIYFYIIVIAVNFIIGKFFGGFSEIMRLLIGGILLTITASPILLRLHKRSSILADIAKMLKRRTT